MISNIFYVYSVFPKEDKLDRRFLGKFLLDSEGDLHVLEDHYKKLASLETDDSDLAARKIQSLQDSMYTEVVCLQDIVDGKRPDLIQETESQPKDTGPNISEYEYHRIGLESPQTLRFENGQAFLDGHPISDVELDKLMENVQSQKAHLDRKEVKSELEKKEELFRSLAKADPHLAEALSHIRMAVKEGSMHPDVLKTITGHIFKDTMIPSMGNKKAYQDFLSRPKQGVHVHLDANDFGSINKVHGFEIGDQAIKAYGTAIRNALDESVGRANAKAFRVGGDEIFVHVPSHEHAARFVRAVKKHFAKIAPISGTHQVSASIGVGEDPKTAEHALIQAKTMKKASAYKLGEAKTHAYSAIKGQEGHLSVD